MSKPFVLIALTGLAGTGKDTVADLLATHCGFYKLAFADGLYNEVSDGFNVPVRMLKERETKEHPLTALALSKCQDDAFVGRMMRLSQADGFDLDHSAPRSPRQILQWWGTEYRRSQNTDYWTSKFTHRIRYQVGVRLSSRFVVTDCRFQNEADIVRDHGGLIWQVTRPGIDAPATAHVSDTAGDGFKPDNTISNSGDILHLQALTLGAYLMHDCGLTAHDITRMGLAHTQQAEAELHAKTIRETV